MSRVDPEVLIDEWTDEDAPGGTGTRQYLVSFDDETASQPSDVIDDCVSVCRRFEGVSDAVRYEREQIVLTTETDLSAQTIAELQRLLTTYLRRDVEAHSDG